MKGVDFAFFRKREYVRGIFCHFCIIDSLKKAIGMGNDKPDIFLPYCLNFLGSHDKSGCGCEIDQNGLSACLPSSGGKHAFEP